MKFQLGLRRSSLLFIPICDSCSGSCLCAFVHLFKTDRFRVFMSIVRIFSGAAETGGANEAEAVACFPRAPGAEQEEDEEDEEEGAEEEAEEEA